MHTCLFEKWFIYFKYLFVCDPITSGIERNYIGCKLSQVQGLIKNTKFKSRLLLREFIFFWVLQQLLAFNAYNYFWWQMRFTCCVEFFFKDRVALIENIQCIVWTTRDEQNMVAFTSVVRIFCKILSLFLSIHLCKNIVGNYYTR